MKRIWMMMALLVVGPVVLAACGASAAGTGSGQPQDAVPVEPQVYRGEVEEKLEDGSIRLVQLAGHNYGQESIVFHINDTTVLDVSVAQLETGAYVEVSYNGILTRSMPPQGNADTVRVVAPRSEGIVVNGTIQTVGKTDTGYTIHLLPLDAVDNSFQNQVILTVPTEALEGLTEEDLVAGAQVSAVTKGIAALSLPPQMPVDTLLPYSS